MNFEMIQLAKQHSHRKFGWAKKKKKKLFLCVKLLCEVLGLLFLREFSFMDISLPLMANCYFVSVLYMQDMVSS